MHVGEHKGDCWFWKMGSCRYSENECGRGLHRPEMLESINGGRKEKEAGARKEHEATAPWVTPSAAPSMNKAPFFEGSLGNQVAELLRTMTTPATEPARMVTSPGVSQEQMGLLLQLLAPMAASLQQGLQGGRPGGQ